MATTGENNGGWAEAKFGSFRLQLSPACKMADKEKHEKSSGAYNWDNFTLEPTHVPAFSCLQLCCKTAILGFCKTYFHTEFFFFKLIFTLKVFQTLSNTEGVFKFIFTQKVFSNLFSHRIFFSNLFSHRKFFKLTFTQKVCLIFFI